MSRRYIRDAENPVEFYNENEFKIRFRFNKDIVMSFLLPLLFQDIVGGNRRGLPIPPIIQVLAALRFYATGNFQIVCGDLHHISQSTISRIVANISKILALKIRRFVKFPEVAEQADVKIRFHRMAGFPGAIGCIDCTHIPIKSPSRQNGEVFRNRKGWFSINVQIVCGPQMEIYDIVARWPGSVHDSRIFANSRCHMRFEGGELTGLLIGDSGYAQSSFMYTPVLNPQSQPEIRYNKAHISTRNIIERFNGVWKRRNRIERTASKRWRGSVRRVVSAAVYNLSCFTHGCSTGWVSGVLGSEALTGGAWLAALPCLVALPAAPFFAVLADARGRKAGAFCICVNFIISWSLAAWCGPRGVWAARVAAGAGGAGALSLAPVYCAEIAPRTRGLAAMPALACSCGILFAYAAGGVLSAHALSLSMAVPPAVLLVSLIWLPETPSFLISVGRIQDAAKIMCWFDGSDFREDLTDVIEQQEVKIRTSDCYGRREPLRRQDSDTFQPMLKRSSGLDSSSEKKREQSACRELFRHRRSRRALFSCLVVLSAAAGSGAGAVNSFATAVLRHSTHSVPHLNLTAYNYTMFNGSAPRPLFEPSEAGSILCGTALVLGAAVATVSVDKLGRKMLLLCSCSGITCCLAILGAYCDPNLRLHSWYSHRLWPYKRTNSLKDKGLQLTENFTSISTNPEWKNYTNDISRYRVNLENDSTREEWKVQNITNVTNAETAVENLWAPVALMSVVLFLYNIGLGSVPYVLISELFTINVRSLASSLLISWMWLSSFFILRYYGTIAVSVGLHGTYYICASITFLGSLYIFFIVPETKGKAQEQIDEDLDGPLFVLKRKRKDRDQR